MMNFLKRFDFSFFQFNGELGLGLGIAKWSISIEFLLWHFSVSFLTDEQRAQQERAKAYIEQLRGEEWSIE